MNNRKSYYFIKSGLPEGVAEIMKKECSGVDIESSLSYDGHEGRRSLNGWITTDCWISAMMAYYIQYANKILFNYDLTLWSDKIQYTVYNGKGSQYTWHNDMLPVPSSFDNYSVRKLSISLCLSNKSDYEGGEFQIMHDPQLMDTIKMGMGDIIVFPSDLTHRVRPLKSGTRISLVGWYGGPPFK